MSASPTTAEGTTAAFRAAVEGYDLEGILATFAPDVVVHSPITDLSHFVGVDEMRLLLEDILVVIEGIRYTQDVGDETWRALFYTARIGGVDVEEATRVRLDGDGRIAEMWLYFRPLPGLATLTTLLGIRLGRRRGRLAGIAITLIVRALPFLTRVGDRMAIRVIGLPRRPS